MKGKKSKTDLDLTNFLKSAYDVLTHPQITFRNIKGKLLGKINSWDKVGFSENIQIKAWNLKRKVIFEIDPDTGEKKEIPMTKEQEKECRKLEEDSNGK